jgi:hypothetical protein
MSREPRLPIGNHPHTAGPGVVTACPLEVRPRIRTLVRLGAAGRGPPSPQFLSRDDATHVAEHGASPADFCDLGRRRIHRSAKPSVRVLAPTDIACLIIVGALLGTTVLAGASVHTLAGLRSFGCAALLFLVTEELLIEAHESADTAVTTTMFFVGFLIFLLLGMIE